MISLSELGENL